MQVEQTGESQFQVLDGEVELWNGSSPQSTLAQRLIKGQGIRSNPDGKLSELGNVASRFVGRQQMLEMATFALQERFDNWKRFSERKRSEPNVLLYYGFDGHAPGTACSAMTRQAAATHLMARSSAASGQPADGRGNKRSEFKRTSDRVRLNVPGEFKSLTFAAWLRLEGFERWLSSLMLTDGHEPGEVHWQLTDLGQLMLGVKAEPDHSHDFYSPSIIGPLDLGRWVHLACVYNGDQQYVSHYLDGVEVSRESVRRGTTLRIGTAEIGNWVPQDLKDFRIRSLNGRVDEFILFDRPLTPDDIQTIYENGKPQS